MTLSHIAYPPSLIWSDTLLFFFFFFFNDTATTEIYTLSLHDALPICLLDGAEGGRRPAEGGAVAVLARDLVGACGGDEDAAGLLGLLAHGQRLRRQDAACEEARALLLRRLLQLAHGRGGGSEERRVGE